MGTFHESLPQEPLDVCLGSHTAAVHDEGVLLYLRTISLGHPIPPL